MIITEEKLLFDDLPILFCPNCLKGTLRIIPDSVIHKHPSWIRLLPDEPKTYYDEDGEEHRTSSYMDIEGTTYEEFITTFFLECNRKQCKEVVSTCGTYRIDQEIEPDEDGQPIYIQDNYFYPKLFHPTLRLFQIPSQTPKMIVEELELAFSLFWSNPSACGNSIRKVVERIVDEIQPNSNNTRLHNRIEQLDTQFLAIKEFLLATKWIGNDGSHLSDLDHYDVIIAFEFIEQCIVELYERHSRDLNSIARKINLNKKPISKMNQ